jgi:hypothetical protein
MGIDDGGESEVPIAVISKIKGVFLRKIMKLTGHRAVRRVPF